MDSGEYKMSNTKDESLKELFEVLADALHNAEHNYFISNSKKAQQNMELADKTMDAIRLLSGDDDWQCKEPHCAYKHNDRGIHG